MTPGADIEAALGRVRAFYRLFYPEMPWDDFSVLEKALAEQDDALLHLRRVLETIGVCEELIEHDHLAWQEASAWLASKERSVDVPGRWEE